MQPILSMMVFPPTNLTFNMGIGEYPIGENILATPSVSLMHMRTYNDQYGILEMIRRKPLNVQIMSFSSHWYYPTTFSQLGILMSDQ